MYTDFKSGAPRNNPGYHGKWLHRNDIRRASAHWHAKWIRSAQRRLLCDRLM